MSRKDGHTQSLLQRPSRAVPALVVSVLVLAGSVGLVWAALSRAIYGSWPTFVEPVRSWLLAAHWNDASVWALGVVLAIVGLLLIVCAAVPGSFSVLKLQDKNDVGNSDDDEFVITRRAIANLARSESEEVDGVATATASASSKRVHLTVATPLRSPGDLRQQVVDAVSSRLASSGVEPLPHVTASVLSKP